MVTMDKLMPTGLHNPSIHRSPGKAMDTARSRGIGVGQDSKDMHPPMATDDRSPFTGDYMRSKGATGLIEETNPVEQHEDYFED